MLKELTLNSSKYPNNLKLLTNCPKSLWVLGDLQENDYKAIAVIGTRKMSAYGEDVTTNLIPSLVKAGFTIISGMAPGIDSLAQETAILCKGRTIGVLGFGFNYLKKSHCAPLAKKILATNQGAIISPFKKNQPPSKWTFIERNKIIAGLALGTLVIEAPMSSGTMYTVDTTLNLGREVFSVPGSIFSYNSIGTHQLLKYGATMVDSAQDIIGHFDKS